MTGVAEAVDALRSGGLVVMPTDTVYGVAALPGLPEAIAKLFAAKGRPQEKAIPVLGASLEDLREVAVLDGRAAVLAEAFWPGPLTIVAEKAGGFAADLGGEDAGTVAVRVPRSEPARALLRASGPLAVTSANRSGAAPATTLEEARRELGDAVAVYLDGGTCAGAASTLVSVVGKPAILRAGPLSSEAVLQKLIE